MANNAEELFEIGLKYHDGTGVPQDSEKALQYYRQSAEQGYDQAQYVMGLYYEGDLSDITNKNADFQKSAEWYKKAAEQNYAPAQFHLAFLYRNGKGVPQDDEKSEKLLLQSAENGHAYAQLILGLHYKSKAIEWLKKSAENGDEEALAELEKIK